jgi:hypothetical protein
MVLMVVLIFLVAFIPDIEENRKFYDEIIKDDRCKDVKF